MEVRLFSNDERLEVLHRLAACSETKNDFNVENGFNKTGSVGLSIAGAPTNAPPAKPRDFAHRELEAAVALASP